MKLQTRPIHLCFCLNAFPGSNWDAAFDALSNKVPVVRRLVPGADSAPFAVGLWLSRRAAMDLGRPSELARLVAHMESNNLYVYTVNAFPFGDFHSGPVKERAYLPDWTSSERVEHTLAIAEILARLPSDGLPGSLSTVPGGYKKAVGGNGQIEIIRGNLLRAAEGMELIHKRTGRKISLAVEMEPDCLWEDPTEFAGFYLNRLERNPYLGVCYDTCHQELLHGVPGSGLRSLLQAAVPVPKIQLSAAVLAPAGAIGKAALEPYANDIYLHQTRIVLEGGSLEPCPDLPDALCSANRERPWIAHYHVPIHDDFELAPLSSLRNELSAVLDAVRASPAITPFLEIETYTYSSLLKFAKLSPEESIAKEYLYVIDRL